MTNKFDIGDIGNFISSFTLLSNEKAAQTQMFMRLLDFSARNRT